MTASETMTQGLYQIIDGQRAALARAQAILDDAERGPRDHYDARHTIEKMGRELAAAEQEAATAEEASALMRQALELAGKLTTTRHTMLAITAVENAASRLRAHLGVDPRIERELAEARAELARVHARGSESKERTLPPCARCGGMGWVPSSTDTDTDPCPVCALPTYRP